MGNSYLQATKSSMADVLPCSLQVVRIYSFVQNSFSKESSITYSLHRVIISGGLCPWKHLIVPHLYTSQQKKLFQYVAHYPAGTSILPLKTKTRFLRRRFKFLVNGVLVLAGLYLEKP